MPRDPVNFLSPLMRRIALLLVALAVPLGWSRSGRTQTACLVDRGQDPLEVIRTGAFKHNVFFFLDTSGSMAADMVGNSICGPTDPQPCTTDDVDDPRSRLMIAKQTVQSVIDDPAFQDASGQPLFNWGFAHFGGNQRDEDTDCVDQFQNECVGMDYSDVIDPPAPGQPDPRPAIRALLKPTYRGGIGISGVTPNGISIYQMGQYVYYNLRSGLCPGQKNFLIYITDGGDTCECEVSWDPSSSGPKIRGSSTTSAPTVPLDNNNTRAYNAGLKARMAYDAIDPRHDGSGGDVFVVGLGFDRRNPNTIDVQNTNHLAWEASGVSYGRPGHSAYLGDDPASLKTAVLSALAQTGNVTATFSTGAPIVGSVKELISAQAGLPGVNPKISPDDVDAVTTDAVDFNRAKDALQRHRDNVLLTSHIVNPGFQGHLVARRTYKVVSQTDPGTKITVETRQPDYTVAWDAGLELQARPPDSRNVYFHKKGEQNARPFQVGQLAAADLGVGVGFLGATSAADAAEIVIRVVRGYRLIQDPATGSPYDSTGKLNFSDKDASGKPTWKLFDATQDGPTLVAMPQRAPETDPPSHDADAYTTFYRANFNRQTMVYLGTNGGILHGFDAHTGAERFAFVPSDLLSLDPGETPGGRTTLKDLVELIVTGATSVSNHPYLLAGSASAEDLWVNGRWRTVLAFGRGAGGKYLTALDVTDVGNWDKSYNKSTAPAQLPTVLWNVGNRQGLPDQDVFGGSYDGLGETWSIPVMGEVMAGGGAGTPQSVLFTGSGYGCKASSAYEGRWLYVLRLQDGSVLRRIDVGTNGAAPIQDNAIVATPTVFNPHRYDPKNPYDRVTRVYWGDLQGNVYKLNTFNTDPSLWSFAVFAPLGADQPVSAPVAILPQDSRILVFAASGGDYRVTPKNGASFKMAGLIDDDGDMENTPGDFIRDGSTAANPFFVGLATGDRVFAAPVTTRTQNGKGMVFFAAARKNYQSGSCTLSFSSTLYAFDATSGLAAYGLGTSDDVTSAQTPGQLDLGAGKVNGLYVSSNHLYLARSGSLSVAPSAMVLGADTYADPPPSTALGRSRLTINVLSARPSPF